MFGGSGHLFFFNFSIFFNGFSSSFGEQPKISVLSSRVVSSSGCKVFPKKMLDLHTFAILLCATGVLTSSVSRTDGLRNETHVDVKNFHKTSSALTETETPQKLSNTNARPIMGEGGPIYSATQRPDSPNSPTSTVVAEGIKITAEDLVQTDSQPGVPKIRNPSVVPRKGAIPPPKIAARKGVGPETVVQNDSAIESVDRAVSVLPIVDETDKKKIDRSDGKKIIAHPKTLPDHASVAIPAVDKSSSNSSQSGNKNATTPTPANATPTVDTNIQNLSTSASSTTKKFKPKPTVTIGEMDIDKPIPASPTKTPPLGMPRKIDYIVPVIITIMALPLLGGAAFFLYRRGRDCWDKRHYRRMDFLIDGMYNDHTSWK